MTQFVVGYRSVKIPMDEVKASKVMQSYGALYCSGRFF